MPSPRPRTPEPGRSAAFPRRVPQLPVLVVLTRRELPRRPAVDALEQALRGRGTLAAELALAPLEDSAVAMLSRAVGALDEEHVAQVVGAAEGNALLAVEQARALAAGELEPPTSLRGAVRAAMAPLADDARRVAELTAVAGRDLDPGELVALPLDDLRAAASRAVQTGLLDAGDGRLGFCHALLREAVYADLPGPHRAHLHEAIATVLIECADASAGRRAAETARHLRLAGGARPGRAHLLPRRLPRLPDAADARVLGDASRVRVSCLLMDIHYDWRLAECDGGTRISVDVEIPEEEAHRLERQREVALASLQNLARLSRVN